tara:strand:- start:11300 stop:12061 length:762 start_codon:yes stop_codon:yes gene_type:complete
MKRIFFNFLFLLLPGAAVQAQFSYLDSIYTKANDFYSRQEYVQAANIYQHILRQNFIHKNLYHNLGNTYYQLGRLGDAIWAYEKGLQFSPGDRDLKYNLKVANARILDRIEFPGEFFLFKWYGALKNNFHFQQWLAMVTLLFFLLSLIYAAVKWTGNNLSVGLRKMLTFMGLLTGLMVVLSVDTYFEITGNSEGIIVVEEAYVFSSPFELSTHIFEIHEGTKAKITSQQQEWLEIEIIGGKKGWILNENIRLL